MVQGVAFDGMATGLETDEIITELMEIERQTIVRQQEDIQEIEEEKEVWQQINQNLVGLDNALDSLSDEDIYQEREAISGNEDVMTVNAEPGAQSAVYRDMRVDELAEANSFMAEDPVWEAFEEVETTTESLGMDDVFTISLDEEEDTQTTINVDTEDSLADIRDSINQAEEGIAQARIVRGRLLIEAEETGEENAIDIEVEDEGILDELTFTEEEHTGAQDATFQIEGMEEHSSTNTGIELTDNITIDLQSVGPENEETFNIEVREDTAAFEDTINQFIESYNEMQSHLSAVTDEEGMLQGDVTARRLQNSMRSAVMSTLQDVSEVNEEIFSLGEMGIEVDDGSVEMGQFDGTMSIADEQDFTDALRENMDEVQNLFLGDQEAGVDGLIERIDEQIGTYMAESVVDRGVVGNRKDTLENDIERIEDNIAREETRMEQREQRLRERFTQLEVAVYEAQQQQQQVMNQIQQLGSASMSDMMM